VRDVRHWNIKKLTIVALFFGTASLVFAFFITENKNPSGEQGKKVAITVTHPTFPSVDFLVPNDYLGPKFLNLSKKNRRGGEQKRFLVQFYFPSLKPNIPKNAHLKETEHLMYMRVSMGIVGGVRRVVVGDDIGKIKTGMMVETGKYVCGYREARNDKFPRIDPKYISDPRVRERNRRGIERYAYYYQDLKNPEGDLYFNCQGWPVNGVRRCRVLMHSGILLSKKSAISIGVEGFPRKYMCDFREIAPRIGQFINDFIVKKGD